MAYIDEAGDDGIRRVRPIDKDGASEWFVIGAYVVEADKASHTSQVVRTLLDAIKTHQKTDIHFNRLNPQRREIVCKGLVEHKARCFIVISHKPNMRGYRNTRAERVSGGKNVFYNFMCRILLEKITRYCHNHSMRRHKESRHIRIEFSNRGGQSYGLMRGYFGRLQMQDQSGNLFLNTDSITWNAMNIEDIHNFDHANRPGLQLADIVTSAFYQALGETDGRPPNTTYAKILKPLLALGPNDNPFGFGVKFMPNYNKSPLSAAQREIFEFYGAPKVVDPQPLTPPSADRLPVNR